MLEVSGLTAAYGRKVILNDVNFKLKEGSICGLIGPNGSGKTTLLRCISGILKPQKGKVHLSGTDINTLSRAKIARQLAFVPQSSGIRFNYTGVDMVIMGKAPHLGLLASPSGKDKEEAAGIMESLGILHLLDRHYVEMSSGEQQMTLLGRAVMQNTPLLLLDEPTSHLDIRNQHIVMEMVSEIAIDGNRTLFITIHDPNLALRYCDHVVMVGDNRLHAEGPTAQVMTDVNLSAIYGMDIKNEITSSGKRVIIQHDSKSRTIN